jgi:hypothetical protein
MSSNVTGARSGSSSQLVVANAVSSVALTPTVTGLVYQPLFPFGAPGVSVIAVTGGVVSPVAVSCSHGPSEGA